MYVRIIRATIDLAQEKEVQRIAEDGLVPALRALPGFRSYLGGLDRSAGKLVIITTWDTEDQAWFSREQIADVASQVRDRGAEFELPEVFEVTAQT